MADAGSAPEETKNSCGKIPKEAASTKPEPPPYAWMIKIRRALSSNWRRACEVLLTFKFSLTTRAATQIPPMTNPTKPRMMTASIRLKPRLGRAGKEGLSEVAIRDS